MAAKPAVKLAFARGCPDCGHRKAILPRALADAGDDFDWQVRDYDGFRLFMMQELAARFPERTRWTPADIEVLIVEILATVLDQLSDSLDRIAAEAFLETARQPSSVRRLLDMIGYNAVVRAGIFDAEAVDGESADKQRERLKLFCAGLCSYGVDYQYVINGLSADVRDGIHAFMEQPESADAIAMNAFQKFLDIAPAEFIQRARNDALEREWASHPHDMERHRLEGPRSVHEQQRMVTLEDYVNRLEEHPLVLRAAAWNQWSGSWNTIRVGIIAWENLRLDQTMPDDEALRQAVINFHHDCELPELPWGSGEEPEIGWTLRQYIDAWRMSGQEVLFEDAIPVGVSISMSIQLADNYYQSEIHQAVGEVLGVGVNGFFAPGRLNFGEDLHVSDLYEVLMALDGVAAVCLNRFKRIGSQYSECADSGFIEFDGLEIAVCDNDAERPGRGYYRLHLHGGKKG